MTYAAAGELCACDRMQVRRRYAGCCWSYSLNYGARDSHFLQQPMSRDDNSSVAYDSRMYCERFEFKCTNLRCRAPGIILQTVLAHVSQQSGISIERGRPASTAYGTLFIENACAASALEHCVVVEVKSVQRLSSAARQQCLTYLRLLNVPVGLLISLGEALLKDGIRRVVIWRV